jgi:hypothetical protein
MKVVAIVVAMIIVSYIVAVTVYDDPKCMIAHCVIEK